MEDVIDTEKALISEWLTSIYIFIFYTSLKALLLEFLSLSVFRKRQFLVSSGQQGLSHIRFSCNISLFYSFKTNMTALVADSDVVRVIRVHLKWKRKHLPIRAALAEDRIQLQKEKCGLWYFLNFKLWI